MTHIVIEIIKSEYKRLYQNPRGHLTGITKAAWIKWDTVVSPPDNGNRITIRTGTRGEAAQQAYAWKQEFV